MFSNCVVHHCLFALQFFQILVKCFLHFVHSVSKILDHVYCYYSELFSGRLSISSSFIWSCRFLPCFFICNIFFCRFIFFFLMGGAVFLSYCLFGLRRPALEFAGSWIELGLGAEMRTSGRLTPIDIPWGLRLSVSPAVWTWSSHHRSSGPTSSLGTKIPQTSWHGKKKKRRKKIRSNTIPNNKNQNKIRKIKNIRKNKTIIQTTGCWGFLPSPQVSVVPQWCLVSALVVRRHEFHVLLVCHLDSAPLHSSQGFQVGDFGIWVKNRNTEESWKKGDTAPHPCPKPGPPSTLCVIF